ncbi:MAG: B-box zinc finger protein [Chloroflexota bacterium]|nr:B-box zinc finger protein [Chloroflexota bacterium]
MSEPLHCVNHPKAVTYLRCNKCGDPICVKCAVQTPVGYRCRDCVRSQQKVFYADFRPIHYAVAAAVALPLALIAGWLIPSLTWYAIILGPLTGGGIANLAHWAIRRRRGQYTWLVVCGCIVAGTLPHALLSLFTLLSQPLTGLMMLLWDGIYLATATGAAYAWLRPGRTR